MAWALAVMVVWSTVFVEPANASSAVQRVFLATGGGGQVALGSASITEVGLGVQWLRWVSQRFRVEGDQIMVKVWWEGSSERRVGSWWWRIRLFRLVCIRRFFREVAVPVRGTYI